MKKILKVVFGLLRIPVRILKKEILQSPRRLARCAFRYDQQRFLKYAGTFNLKNKEALLARIIMGYHVIEKGLTMPRRHLDFGHDAILGLIQSINDYSCNFGVDHSQVCHAIGCIKAYYDLHAASGFDMSRQKEFWDSIKIFCAQHDVLVAEQMEITRDAFYSQNECSFPQFAKARHTLRHYKGTVDINKIMDSVRLAMTAPSACNRQYVHVYCISNHAVRDAVLGLQNGNRGFGHDSDKLLVITSDLMGVRWVYERNDVYTNAGIFIMNLCYALHYNRIAHCILNWSVSPSNDIRMRKMLKIRDSEVVVSVLSCGNAPEKFFVAASPRKELKDVFVEIV